MSPNTPPVAPTQGRFTTVHIVERMAPGGIETLVLDMAKGMAGCHTVFSLAGSRSELVRAWPRLAALNGNLEAFGRLDGLKPGLVLRIAKRLRALRPDRVIVHHVGPMVYGGLAAQLARVPKILHVEHDAWHYDSPRRRAVAKLLFKMVRPRRVAVSREIASKVEGYFGGDAVVVIPPGIDMEQFRPRDRTAARARLGLATASPIIGTSGRLVAVKNQGALIDALARIRQAAGGAATPLPELVIVGDGPERANLESQVDRLGLARFVHLLGHRDDMADILPAFDVFCLPSLNEGLPRSVLEAQAVGLPVVASDVGALRAAVCPETGRLVPPADVGRLADALTALLTVHPAPSVSRAFVEQRYALTSALAAFETVLQH